MRCELDTWYPPQMKRPDRGRNVTAKEHNLVVKFAKKCLREICKKDYELPVTYQEAVKGLTVRTKFKRQCSYAFASDGAIMIDIWKLRENYRRHEEYARFSKDPVIGDISDASPEMTIFAIVAHEVAHHVQYIYGPKTRWLKNSYQKPHGKGFQAIYRILRSRVVNHLIIPKEEVA